ncbi:MAG: YheU family protein [Magnetococcales bacterium]|nr:YheU family protein [Magnetococcales bacterium]
MEIPFEQLNPDVLYAIAEDYVTREGTDYGAVDHTLEVKVAQVLRQIKLGQAVIRFDPKSETCGIFPKE